ncbi:MAG TPA: hypothetical protein DGG94_05185 [Micromonosporaceae bacterium]|nr:hypothetical protein [Micromonosporaceae bacterium]HCU49193.1 hypothetical protein [Micromonosporaceae bacterium]
MDLSLLIGVGGTLMAAVLGFLANMWTSRNSLEQVKLQGEQQHRNQMQLWRVQQLAHSYQELGSWLTSVYHATHDLQLKETWRSDEDYPDFETEIRNWEQGTLRLPETVAATRVAWSYSVRRAEVQLRTRVELYVATATDRDSEDEWIQAMYDGLDEILILVDRMLIGMREEVYGSDASYEAVRERSPGRSASQHLLDFRQDSPPRAGTIVGRTTSR